MLGLGWLTWAMLVYVVASLPAYYAFKSFLAGREFSRDELEKMNTDPAGAIKIVATWSAVLWPVMLPMLVVAHWRLRRLK